ncbi:MAG TPA: DUF1343 domain-containing protein [Cytophagales bacterium]|jgi:uncharacterized protein YbbC (DUF1343 family)|nr:DUF1343 domain-containing protein [Cytophagales bacterium]
MPLRLIKNTVLLFVLSYYSCANSGSQSLPINSVDGTAQQANLITGANQTSAYLPLLKGKKIAIVANQTSVIFKDNENEYTHLVDSLIKHNVEITRVFAPEHGFRGIADAGEVVEDGTDTKTGVSIVSLYGKNKKPQPNQLKGIDLMVFDIQDVGVRFYTYISTLHYVMEACAENQIPLLILDRPNPNGHYIDGPILNAKNKSFVGMHPIPVVHGMTIGEYALMINGEDWLNTEISCDLKVIKVLNYTHEINYDLPIKPSPNLPNSKAVNLYPSLCFFEGTNVSVGRGTNMQFQVIGSPYLKAHYDFVFTPRANDGAKYPKHENLECYGLDLRDEPSQQGINLSWLIEFYKAHMDSKPDSVFFNDFFRNLAGTDELQQQIERGWTSEAIKKSWQSDLIKFHEIRKKYLIYP